MYAIKELVEMFEKSDLYIRKVIEKLNIPLIRMSKTVGKNVIYFRCVEEQYIPSIEKYIEEQRAQKVRVKEKTPEQVKYLEQMRKAHPLVKNDKFFNLLYFPNVIPFICEE